MNSATADIEEYMRFASDSSPYNAKVDTFVPKVKVHSVNPDAEDCTYAVYVTKLTESDESTVRGAHDLYNVLYSN